MNAGDFARASPRCAARRASPPILATIWLWACAHHADAEWVRTELVFGREIAGPDDVDDAELQSFVDRVVRPRLPGWTLLDGHGGWTSADGKLETEPSVVLVYVHHRGQDDAALEQIRQAWCAEFHQESVLRIDTAASVSF